MRNVQKYSNDMCSKGMWEGKKRSAWWDEEIKELVREKIRLFKIYVIG